MSIPRQDAQRFVEVQSLDEWIQALEGSVHELNVNGVIRLDAALQALHNGLSLIEIVNRATWQFEKLIIERVLISTRGNRAHALRLLKIDYKVLSRSLHKYGL